MFRLIIFSVILIFTNYPQSLDKRILEKTDFLKQKVNNSTGSEKLNNYIDFIDYLSLNQPNKALLEKDSIFLLAKNLNNKDALTKIYLILGTCYSEVKKNKEALDYYEKALELSKQTKDSIHLSRSLIKIGVIKITAGQLDESLKHFEEALDISKRNNDIKNEILAINYLGILNYILEDLEEAEKLSFKGLELSKKHNYLEGLCLANEHLAIIRIQQQRYIEALEFNDKAYDISLQRDFIANLPATYYNYAVIYNRMKNFDKAIDYLNQSEKLRFSFGDIRGSGSDLGMMGRIYLAKNDYRNAIDKFKKAEVILREYDALRTLVPILRGLATAYENIGDYKSALNYFKEFKEISDSVDNENVKRQIAISNAKRQLEEKEKEIKYLEETKNIQAQIQQYLIIFIVIILTLLGTTIFLFLNVRKSRKNLFEINQKLITLNNERDKFFSIISHDLKSPFLGILGLTDLLKEELNDSENQRSKELIDKLDKAVNNQYKLVDNLLNWTIIQTGKMIYEPKEFLITDVLNEAVENLNNFSLQKNIRIKTNIEKDFLIWADRNMVSSILRNLISNAIKYSYEDSDVVITISQKSDDVISVQIKDSGVGIPENNVSKIFGLDSNISTEGTAKEKGTGLGLLIVKEMVSINKGEISVTSKENLGSIFEFTLPIARR